MINSYSDEETSLVVELRESGLIGQRMSNAFRKVYPDRSHASVLNKVQYLRNRRLIR